MEHTPEQIEKLVKTFSWMLSDITYRAIQSNSPISDELKEALELADELKLPIPFDPRVQA